jgi:glycerophosphoryl diester phosphodiesterase
MEIFGHRGAAGLVAENTLAGFRRAAELGCHGIECDVRTVEGRLALLHDATVDRTTDGRGTLDQLGADGLRRLDTGAGPVPWVAEVLPLMAEHPELVWNLELKGVEASYLLIKEMETWPESVRRRALVSSFLRAALEPWVATGVALARCVGALTPALQEDTLRLGCCAAHLDVARLRPEVVPAARRAGLTVRVYTVNDVGAARRLAGLGVQGVFTDRPDRLVGAFES